MRTIVVLGNVVAMALMVVMTGCHIDGVIFMTKTGIAVDADTQPPTLDIGYLRHEGVIASVYEDVEAEADGESRPLVHPVLTTVGTEAGGLGIELAHSFATGPAALVIADALTENRPYAFGTPGSVPRPSMDGTLIARKGKKVPYFFGTDTSLGLSVSWAAGNVPRAVSIGYKKKELAIVPLQGKPRWYFWPWDRWYSEEEMMTLQKDEAHMDPADVTRTVVEGTPPPGSKALPLETLIEEGHLIEYEESRLPSLIATAQGGANVGTKKNTGINVGQTFATGAAATLLAKHPQIRQVLGRSLVPNYDEVLSLGSSASSRANMNLLQSALSLLTQMAKEENATALIYVNGLNKDAKMAADTGVIAPFKIYKSFANDEGILEITKRTGGKPTTFDDIVSDVVNLSRSVKALTETARANAMVEGLKLKNGSDVKELNAPEIAALQQEFATQKKLLASATSFVETNETLLRALEFLRGQLIQTSEVQK